LNHVWLFAAVALVALRPLVVPIPPHDFWWHMATGRLIVQSGSIPRIDQFSYTQAGEPFYNQGWLAQVLLYALHSLGGVPLILVFQAAILALAYGMLLWLCIRRSGAVRLSVGVLLLLLPLSFDNWHVRPQTYAVPLFVAFLVVLHSWRTSGEGGTGRLWLLPLLMVVWVNLHGSFVLGGALMALTFAGEGLRRFVAGRSEAASTEARPALRTLFLWGLVTAVAILVNPRGIGVIGYVFGLLGTSAVTSLVQEWAAPVIRTATGAVFFLYVMVFIAVLVYARRRPPPVDMLLAAALFWLALGAERNIIWFALFMTPLIAEQAASWLPARPQPTPAASGVPAMNGVLIGMLLLLLLLALPWVKPHLALPPTIRPLLDAHTPVQAVQQMQADPQRPERLFHSPGSGSYMIWAAPQQPVFIDTRIELYPYEQWLDYINLSAGNQVDALLDKYRIDGVLLTNDEQAGLLQTLQDAPGWQVRYEDEYTTYMVRR
jgi:hypothetical protein